MNPTLFDAWRQDQRIHESTNVDVFKYYDPEPKRGRPFGWVEVCRSKRHNLIARLRKLQLKPVLEGGGIGLRTGSEHGSLTCIETSWSEWRGLGIPRTNLMFVSERGRLFRFFRVESMSPLEHVVGDGFILHGEGSLVRILPDGVSAKIGPPGRVAPGVLLPLLEGGAR